MALKTIVKVGKISTLSDARYCAGMGVDMLGFCVNEGQDSYVTPESFREIRGWFSGPRVVAEAYGIKSSMELNNITLNYLPDLLEVSHEELPYVQPESRKFILSIDSEGWAKHEAKVLECKNQIEFLLLPIKVDKALVHELSRHFKILVQGFSLEESTDILNSDIAGINLLGSSEERPGFKSYDQLSEILESLEIEG
jgi:phosphoribosylanthranilate isomerase